MIEIKKDSFTADFYSEINKDDFVNAYANENGSLCIVTKNIYDCERNKHPDDYRHTCIHYRGKEGMAENEAKELNNWAKS
jgi:hypothetical protein